MRHTLLSLLLCAAPCAAQPPVPPVIYDNDGTELLFNLYHDMRGPLTAAQLDSLVDMQRGTQVGAWAVCAGSDFFHYRSRYGPLIGDDRDGEIPTGGNVALYRNLRLAHESACQVERAGGGDFIARSLRRAREGGMQAMLTFRLNDLHFTSTDLDCPVAYNPWWLQHPELWIGDDTQGWHTAGAYDFAQPRVRERKVAVMREQIARYGSLMDWYMIDFMRFFCYFKPGEGSRHCEEMTAMLRQVSRAIRRESRRLGRPIRLAVRVAPSLAENMEKSLDVRQWLREGLIDLLAVGVHTRMEPNAPLRQLRRDLGPALTVPLYASNDMVAYSENEPVSEGMLRGFCSNALGQGADGIYLFNYFFSKYTSGHYAEGVSGWGSRVPHPRVLGEVGSLATLEGRNKVYWLSDGRRQFTLRPNTPLPLRLRGGESREVTLFVGDTMRRVRPREVVVFYRTRGDARLTVSLAGQTATSAPQGYARLYDRDRGLAAEDRQYAVVLPAGALRHGDNALRFTASPGAAPTTLRRVEIAVRYGSVEECGYF